MTKNMYALQLSATFLEVASRKSPDVDHVIAGLIFVMKERFATSVAWDDENNILYFPVMGKTLQEIEDKIPRYFEADNCDVATKIIVNKSMKVYSCIEHLTVH